MQQMVEALRHKREVPGSIPGGALGNFLVTFSFVLFLGEASSLFSIINKLYESIV